MFVRTGRRESARKNRARRLHSSLRLPQFGMETLEARSLLAADFQNEFFTRDVNDDGILSPLDSLIVINRLNLFGTGPLGSTNGQPPQYYYDTNGDTLLSPLDSLLVLNLLNLGTPPAENKSYVSPNSLQTNRTLAQANQSTTIPFSLSNDAFVQAGSSILVRILASPSAGSSFNPGTIQVRDSQGNVVVPVGTSNNTPFGNSSHTIVALTRGDYVIEVSGEGGTTGSFILSAAIVGDVDGDGAVTNADRKSVGGLIVSRTYNVQADANLDGVISSEDYQLTRTNNGDGTSLITTPPEAGVSRDDSVNVERNKKLDALPTGSLLANDDFRNPFPVGLRVTSFDAKSILGADIAVNQDGTFTYDPRSIPQLANLKRGQTKIDRFNYKTSTTDESVVYVSVVGVSEGADDIYEANEDSVLNVPLASGVLANDPGANPTVTQFDATSKFGAIVQVNADGSFLYDPRDSAAIQHLVTGQSNFDFFSYQSTNQAGEVTTALVSVQLTGKDDLPVANPDFLSLTNDAASATGLLLLNDTDADLQGASGLVVSQSPTQSTLGATVTVNAKGEFEYDASSLAAVQQLRRGQVLADSFRYTVSDGTNTDSSEIFISIVGEGHEVVAVNDAYDIKRPTSMFVAAASGLLANDSDDDEEDILTVIASDAVSQQGAIVTVFPDGSFLYESYASYADGSLREGDVGKDTFTYTVTDGTGSTKTATATVTVTGTNNGSSDDLYVIEVNKVLNVPAANGVLLNDPLTNATVIESPIVTELGGVLLVAADGSFSYDPTGIDLNDIGSLIDKDGVFFDTFEYVSKDGVIDGLTVPATVRIKVLADPSSFGIGGGDPANNPSTTAVIDNRVLKIATPTPSQYGGEIVVEVFNILGNSTIRVLAVHYAIIPATAQTRRSVVQQELLVGDFAAADFDTIDFEGSSGDDALLVSFDLFNVVTARGGDGSDYLTGGSNSARLEGGKGDDVLIGGQFPDELLGGDGNDELVGDFGPDILRGGNGHDELFGGDGDDELFGDAGADLLNGGGGFDRMIGGSDADRFYDNSPDSEPSLLLNVNRNEGDVYLNSIPRTSIVSGISTLRQTNSDLSIVGGNLVAAVADMTTDGNGKKTGTTVILNGPTLYGYTLVGNWTVTQDNAGNETFTNQGDLTIKTAYGDVRLPTNLPLSITTKADIYEGVGVLDATFNLKDFIITLLTGSASASSQFEDQLKSFVGAELNIPGNVAFGFALGHQIKAMSGFEAVPLANPIPYFYFRYNMGVDLVKLGGNSVSASLGTEIIAAFDPLDPMLFVKVVPPVGGVSMAIGSSKNGYLPYRAENALPNFKSLFNGTLTFGHVYLEGSIDISEFIPKIPLKLNGNILLDLDANDDGSLIGGAGNLADDILFPSNNASSNNALKRAFGNIAGDIAVGMNGSVDLVAPLPGNFLSLSIPLGGASLLTKSGIVAFSGASAQPFEDVPFLNGLTVAQSTFQGFVNTNNSDFEFKYQLSNPKFYGVSLNTNQQEFKISNNGASLHGSVSTPLGVTAAVSGSLNFNTGAFTFSGKVDYGINLIIFKPSVTLSVSLSNYGGAGYGLYFTASFSAGFQSKIADADFSLSFRFTAAQNGFNIGGSGSIDVDLPDLLLWDPDFDVDLSLSNSGFSADLGALGTINVTW